MDHHHHRPGMDAATGRCGTCDGRYCGTTCGAREGHVHVQGVGWRSPEDAAELERQGRRVQWSEAWDDATQWVRPATPPRVVESYHVTD